MRMRYFQGLCCSLTDYSQSHPGRAEFIKLRPSFFSQMTGDSPSVSLPKTRLKWGGDQAIFPQVSGNLEILPPSIGGGGTSPGSLVCAQRSLPKLGGGTSPGFGYFPAPILQENGCVESCALFNLQGWPVTLFLKPPGHQKADYRLTDSSSRLFAMLLQSLHCELQAAQATRSVSQSLAWCRAAAASKQQNSAVYF